MEEAISNDNVPLVLSVHESDGKNVTVMKDIAYSLVTGGGKPGHGYPCVMVVNDDSGFMDDRRYKDGKHLCGLRIGKHPCCKGLQDPTGGDL